MKKINSIIAILICTFAYLQISTSCFSQNLVPNPSFENFSPCPDYGAQISYASPWVQPTWGDPDLYSTCSTALDIGCGVPLVGVPDNGSGTQTERTTGSSYAGLLSYTDLSPEMREYIQVQLTPPLVANTTYNVSFYVSLAERTSPCTMIDIAATNNLGAYISTTAPTNLADFVPLPVSPQINSAAVITSTTAWTLVSGTFNSGAGGGQQYITIGNFFSEAATTIQILTNNFGTNNRAYYYIDDANQGLKIVKHNIHIAAANFPHT